MESMAQRTIVTITDDLDGSDDAQSVTFSFKDTIYTVDLSARNQQKLLKALEPFITAGKVVSQPSRGTRAPRSSTPAPLTLSTHPPVNRRWTLARGPRGCSPTQQPERAESESCLSFLMGSSPESVCR